jgi:hypothetical protein
MQPKTILSAASFAFALAASAFTVGCESSDPDRAPATLPDAGHVSTTPGEDAGSPPVLPAPSADAGSDAAPDAAPVVTFDWMIGTYTWVDYMGTHPLRTNVLTLAKGGQGSFDVTPEAYLNPAPSDFKHATFPWSTDGKSITAGETVYTLDGVSKNCRTVQFGNIYPVHVLQGAACPTSADPLTPAETSRVGSWRFAEGMMNGQTGRVLELEFGADRLLRMKIAPSVFLQDNPAAQTQEFFTYYVTDAAGVVHGFNPMGIEDSVEWKVGDVMADGTLNVCQNTGGAECFLMSKVP